MIATSAARRPGRLGTGVRWTPMLLVPPRPPLTISAALGPQVRPAAFGPPRCARIPASRAPLVNGAAPSGHGGRHDPVNGAGTFHQDGR